jgi:hypothetical protein
MAHMELQKFTTEFVPANYKVNETKALFSVTPGELIIGGCARVLTAFDDTNCTITLGDDDVDGYMTSAQIDPQNTGIHIFGGADMVNSLGQLITNATTQIVNAVYTQGDTDGTTGKLRVTIVKGRIEP